MRLASYKGTRAGWQGIFNGLIRWRLDGPHSHTEVVFEPGDLVDHLMPDRSAQAVEGAYWCASAVAVERLPAWSIYRAGRVGGVRFKRISLDRERWDVIGVDHDPLHAAEWFRLHEGQPYSWRLIAKFLAWAVSIAQEAQQWTCSSCAAAAFGHCDSWRFDPCLLHVVERDHVCR